MPSPFPGMDPYLEDQGYWPDFHMWFITCWVEILASQLPDHYDARMEERVYLVEVPEVEVKLIRPDIALMRRETGESSIARAGAVATLEPVTLPLPIIDEVREISIRVTHRDNQTLVAVLELLSPTNNSGTGRGVYLERRAAVLSQPVHLVELDLLLNGHRLPMGRPLPAGHFYTFISRSDQRRKSDVYAWNLHDPLPTIPIPLKAPDSDVAIDLAQVFALAYQRGRYDRACRYAAEFNLALDAELLRWVQSQAATAT